ncbi:MAG: protein translocase subunit SecF [Anaerolineales bacterium]|nr:protein translocase subunit SecF [Anaerolineales bacterium]
MNIIGKRYWFFGLSLLIIIPGIVALALGGLKPSIDFTGGTMLEILFNSGTAPAPNEVRTALANLTVNTAENSLESMQIQTLGEDGIVLRVQQIDQATIDQVLAVLNETFGGVTLNLADNVGASVGGEVAQRAAGAVALAAVAIALYIWFAFRKLPNASRYGLAAVFSMLHDVLILLGLEAILGLTLGWEADALFLTAVLTVIGYSVHDTIVVFDRIRENRVKYKYTAFESVVNHSIVQTLDRSINTTLTVLFTLFAMALFGGVTTRNFIIILLVGMASGAYSSIFNAAAILVVWENREWENWFSRFRRPAKAKA